MRVKFQSIEAGRGVAAILVVLYHASAKVFAAPKYWNTRIFGGFFDFGHSGVSFFFVLSGFIVAYVHAGDIGHSDRLMSYLRSRLLRIYPVYWIVLTATLAMTAVGFAAQVSLTPRLICSSFFLIGDDAHYTLLAVAWTLYHEVAFYAVFGLAIFSLRAGVGLAGLWIMGIGASAFGYGFLPIYLANPINLLFLLGILTWWVSVSCRYLFPIIFAWLGAAAFLALGIENVFYQVFSEAVRNLLYGVSSALTIAALVAREYDRPIKVPVLLANVGAASFSIYLIHYPLLGCLARLHWIKFVRELPTEAAFFMLVSAVTILGVLFNQKVERRILSKAKLYWDRSFSPEKPTDPASK